MRFARVRSSKQKLWFRLAFVVGFGLVILCVVHSTIFMINFASLSQSPLFGGSYLPAVQVSPVGHDRGTTGIAEQLVRQPHLETDSLSPALVVTTVMTGTDQSEMQVERTNTADTVVAVSQESSQSSNLPVETNLTITDAFPWRIAAPNIDVSIPPWMEAYITFHNEALQNAHQQNKDTDRNKYLIFSCHKSCSGTGNRQRAIMASFIVAIITNRIFLIDITFPVQLELILQPNRIQWNHIPPHLKELKSRHMKLRNKNPPVLDKPSNFVALDRIPVLYIEANSPVNLEHQWRSQEVRAMLAAHGVGRGMVVPGNLYQQIFCLLYRPSPRLTAAAVELRERLGVGFHVKNEPTNDTATSTTTTFTTTTPVSYIAVHARTGGDGVSWKDADRFTTDKLDNLYGNALMVRRGFLQSNKNNNDNTTILPIVVVSDDPKAKKILYDKDPTVVRYADTKIIHVDRSGPGVNDLEGSLAVWADVLILAQATCIVKGRGSFSMLGAWLAPRGSAPACMQLVI